MCMYLLRKHTKLTYQQLGDYFNKDHSTVLYAEAKIDGYATIYPSVKSKLAAIRSLLFNNNTKQQ